MGVFGGMLTVSYLHAWRGVELQLHLPHELQAVFWFMEHFGRLKQKLTGVLGQQPAVAAAAEKKQAAKQAAAAPKGKKGKKDKKEKKQSNKEASKGAQALTEQLAGPKQSAEQMLQEVDRAVCQ